MKTIHDENLIKELNESFCRYFDFDYDSEQAFEHKKDLKEYSEYIREKTIDECIARVPDEGKNVTFSCKTMNPSGIGAWNWCREQTITNLTNLKNNG